MKGVVPVLFRILPEIKSNHTGQRIFHIVHRRLKQMVNIHPVQSSVQIGKPQVVNFTKILQLQLGIQGVELFSSHLRIFIHLMLKFVNHGCGKNGDKHFKNVGFFRCLRIGINAVQPGTGQKFQRLGMNFRNVRTLQILLQHHQISSAEKVECMPHFVDVSSRIIIVGKDIRFLPTVKIGGEGTGAFVWGACQIIQVVSGHIIDHFACFGGNILQNTHYDFDQFAGAGDALQIGYTGLFRQRRGVFKQIQRMAQPCGRIIL